MKSFNMGQGTREIKASVHISPVPRGAVTVIGVSTLPPIIGNELFITMVKEAILNSYQTGER